jgi:chemotaxis protein MotB
MRPRRQRHAEEALSHERWLVSYADFMTLLFAFFVVLFAATYRDNQAVRKISKAIHNGFQTMGAFPSDESGVGGPFATTAPGADKSPSRIQNDPTATTSASDGSEADMQELRRQLEAAMGQELRNHEVVIQVTPEGFVISLKELGFFNSGQAELLPGASEKIVRIAKVLSRPGLDIRIEGHSDNQPIHTTEFRSNWELSAARAMAVLRLLVDDSGFDPKRVSASGYGEYHPVADNASTEGRRMNRRVDLVVVQSRHTAASTQ